MTILAPRPAAPADHDPTAGPRPEPSLAMRTSWWLLTAGALFFAIVHGLSLSNAVDQAGIVVMVFAAMAFTAVHGISRYGWRSMLTFFLIAAFWSYLWENLSIHTGFPFGSYHYDNSWGPKLIDAPYFLALGYFQLAYLSWNMAHLLLGRYSNTMRGRWLFVMPTIASLVMVMLDYVFDPYNSTLQGHYVWHHGGAFFGVPFSNYLGWYLCVWTMYQTFAVFQYFVQRRRPDVDQPAVLFSKAFWLTNIATFCAWAVTFIMKGFTVDQYATVASLDGIVWRQSYLLQTGGLIALTTMGFVAVLALLKLTVLDEMPSAEATRH